MAALRGAATGLRESLEMISGELVPGIQFSIKVLDGMAQEIERKYG